VQISVVGMMKAEKFKLTLDNRSATIHNYFWSHSHYQEYPNKVQPQFAILLNNDVF
jgi:hypothetical protein